jgi:hypothetical protein
MTKYIVSFRLESGRETQLEIEAASALAAIKKCKIIISKSGKRGRSKVSFTAIPKRIN